MARKSTNAQNQKDEIKSLKEQLKAKKRTKNKYESLKKNSSYQKRQEDFVIYAICSICYKQAGQGYIWKLDLSSTEELPSSLPFILKKERNTKENDITSDRLIQFFYQNNVCYEKSSSKGAYPQLIKQIINDPEGCSYLLIYLAKLLKNFSIFEHYGIYEKDFKSYSLFSRNACTSSKVNIPFKEFISEIATLLSGKGPNLINGNLKIKDLIKNGWRIIADEKAIRIYDSNPHHSASLQNAILSKAKQSPEIQYLLFGNNLKSNRNAEDILKLITNIHISSIDSPCDDRLIYQIALGPLLETCQSLLENKIGEVLIKEPREYSSWDAKLFLGKIANSEAARNRPHIFTEDIDVIAKATPTEKDILDDAEASGIVIKNNPDEKDSYSFCNKYIRIILDGFFTSQQEIFKSSCSENIEKALREILNYGDGPEATDHRRYQTTEASFFAMNILQNISCSFRDNLILSLCNNAKDLSTSILQENDKRHKYCKKRLYQEISSLILSYFLYTSHHQLTIESQKKIFDICYAAQWYPQQFDLLEDFLKKSRFFAEYIGSEFSKSREKHNGVIYAQPKFFFLQQLYSGKKQYGQFLQNAIECQHNTWHFIGKILDSRTNEYHLMKKAIDDFCTLSLEDFSSSEIVIASHLLLYSLSNVAEKLRATGGSSHYPCEDLLRYFEMEKYALRNMDKKDLRNMDKNALKDIEKKALKKYEQKLLFCCIRSDYHQKLYNPIYVSSISNPRTDRTDMLLICGAYRVINSISFDVSTISLPEQYVENYRKWICSEAVDTRYFWFAYRLLSYTDFPLGSLGNSPDEKAQFTEQELKDGYSRIDWLQYDNFPARYEDFIKNPRTL